MDNIDWRIALEDIEKKINEFESKELRLESQNIVYYYNGNINKIEEVSAQLGVIRFLKEEYTRQKDYLCEKYLNQLERVL